MPSVVPLDKRLDGSLATRRQVHSLKHMAQSLPNIGPYIPQYFSFLKATCQVFLLYVYLTTTTSYLSGFRLCITRGEHRRDFR